MNLQKTEILDHGNCKVARLCGKAAYVKDVSPRTETWYKADGAGELAQHSEASGSAPEVNHGVVHRNNALLPGEASSPWRTGHRCGGAPGNGRVTGRGVSRGHSSRGQRAGSSCRREARPVKVSGWLIRSEGPNPASGTNRLRLRTIVRLSSGRTVFRRSVPFMESTCREPPCYGPVWPVVGGRGGKSSPLPD